MKNQTKVVGYIRCASKDNTEKGISIQKEAIKDFCKDKGYTLLRFYEDIGQSGLKADGQAFFEMLADSYAGKFDAVIVHKIDRFSRNIVELNRNKNILKANNVDLYSAYEINANLTEINNMIYRKDDTND